MTEIETLLIDLAHARDSYEASTLVLANALEGLMPPEVKKAQDECKARMQPLMEAEALLMAEAEAVVRSWVLGNAQGGKAGGLEATYTAGRTTWDTKGLDKATKLIPALADYRKTGDPYVTIRKAKDEA